MHIDFDDRTRTVAKANIDLLHKLLLFSANKEDVSENAEVSVTFVDNDRIQKLNDEYRNNDQVTDVLSFGLQSSNQEYLNNDPNIPFALGDIVISIEKAKEQAKEYQHTLQRELSFLTVHGFLHLLGYDHETEKDEKVMFQKQENILKEFGLER